MGATLRGLGVSHGVAIGGVRHMGTAVLEPPARQIRREDAPGEQDRARRAVEAVAADLNSRGQRAGGEAQAVLEAQALMAQDPELLADVERRIGVGSTAERGCTTLSPPTGRCSPTRATTSPAGSRTWTTYGTGSWRCCWVSRCPVCRTVTRRMC